MKYIYMVKEVDSRFEEENNYKKMVWVDDEETRQAMTVIREASSSKASKGDDQAKKKVDKPNEIQHKALPLAMIEQMHEMHHVCLSRIQSREDIGDEIVTPRIASKKIDKVSRERRE
ncbi:hypothetical protein KI387_041921, partial [Taxus chinensis]